MFSHSVLEKTRGSHEDIERYQTAVVDLLKQPPRIHRERVRQDHIVKNFLDHICTTAATVADLYDDKTGAMRDEIVTITGTGTNTFQAYYDQVRDLKEYHRNRALAMVGSNLDDEDAARGLGAGPSAGEYDVNDVMFSGPERGGKNLDLNELFVEYQNIDEANHSTIYTSYLQSLATMDPECVLGVTAPETIKQALHEVNERNVRMIRYLAHLRVYLIDYFARAQPIYDIDAKIEELDAEFERKWEAGELDLPMMSSAADNADDGLDDLDCETEQKNFSSNNNNLNNNDLNNNNNNILNNNTECKPIVCELCEKTFAKETVFECHCGSKAHKAKERKLESLVKKWHCQRKDAVHLAYVVTELCAVLRPVIQDTVDYISRKQARTTREIDEEAFMDEEIDSDEEMAAAEAAGEVGGGSGDAEGAEGEQVRKTIDNYPVGWDGKPIPFWIYKMYGLDIEFKCEICGNTSYWGRRAFERHFQEWRHSHGMALLGIPNTQQFFEITKIDDAIKLWHKVCADREKNEWRPDADEECEDVEGNVYNKKMFDALVKQGIIAKPK